MTRLTTVLASIASTALVALSLAAPAQAEFGFVPGSTIGKTHEPCPLIVGSLGSHIADRSCIEAAEPVSQAGAHPDATGAGDLLDFSLTPVKNFIVETPPGFLGNPTVVPACDRESFRNTYDPRGNPAKGCSAGSQIGVATVDTTGITGEPQTSAVYRIAAAPGYPASFGFRVAAFGILVNGNVRTDGDYGLTIGSTDIAAGLGNLETAVVTLWGDPANPIHDPDRWDPTKVGEGTPEEPKGDWGASSGLPRIPFTQTPMDCSNNSLVTVARIDNWTAPGEFLPDILPAGDPLRDDYEIPAPQPTGCEKLRFKPSIKLVPSAPDADSPTGVSVQLDVPQNQDPEGLSTPQLKKAVVTLPEGMSVNPAAADGIRGCSAEQIGLLTTAGEYPNPIRFAKGEPSCPQASKVGRLRLRTALLDEELNGDVYLAEPYDNPFDSLLALYLVIRGPGFTVKVPGKVEPDPATGRLISTFDHSPQLSFDELDLDFFGGPRAPLATSPLCGTQEILTELTPWSAPQSGPPAAPESKYMADRGPSTGGGCSHSLSGRPFSPDLTAGTGNPIAGGFSPLTLRLTRPDGHQPLAGLTVKPPLGFTAVLKGMATCTEAQIAAAAANSGKAESQSPSCPEASRVGHTLTGAGAGPTPLFTKGEVYLAGPYKGAPLSLAVITPAIAGGTPGNEVFDLGTVVVRVALHIDPVSAQVTAISDPVPQTLEGIPLRIRDIRVNMDRPKWGVNPTSCAEKLFEVSATGQNGATANLSNRFQVVECANLGFKPPLSLTLRGGTKRGAHPALRAVVKPRPGDANIARAAVTLARSSFLDQAHIRTICTRVQWAADACPKAAIYGRARAFTPLLDKPLEGPVYLRSSNNLLPDLAIDLRGPAHQPIRVELIGRVDSVKGGIRNTIEATPDAQVEKFVLNMQGGKKGLIVNSRNLCSKPSFATARLKGHNGRNHNFRPRVRAVNCKKQRKGKKAKRSAHKRGAGWSSLSSLRSTR
jgi:hypothetical protein